MILYNMTLVSYNCCSFTQESCDINASNFSNNLTPLHLAAQRGYSRIIEALIGYGVDLNATAGDGQTPLHLILTLKSMQQPNQDTPEFAKARMICINVQRATISGWTKPGAIYALMLNLNKCFM